MKEFLPKLLFTLALMAVAFAYGFVSHWKEVFPYHLFREAKIAFEALKELEEDQQIVNVQFFEEEAGVSGPTYRQLSPDAGREMVFFLGNNRTYRNETTGTAYLAWIADRNGNVVHAWKDPGEIWSPLADRDAVGGTWESYPIGAYLYPNGDILVSYQAYNTFPISMGLAKFDKDSRLIWKNNAYYHHWFSVAPSGEIYVPNTVIGMSPMQMPDRRKQITCGDERFPYDSISVLDPDGNEIREIDLLASFANSDLTGVFNSNTEDHETIPTCDPMHLNDIQVLMPELAAEFPAFSAGDLLLSFRSLNGVGVLDPQTELFKWFYVGASHHQHSPRYFRENKVLMFDNYGNRESLGTSRVLQVEVGSGRHETLFPRSGVELPQRNLFSQSGGHIDLERSGDRALVVFSLDGYTYEIDSRTGEALWEFVNTHEVEGRPARIHLYVAKYVHDLDFEPNHGQL